MDLQLAAICLFTFIIHWIGTLAYAARIAGVRTRRIAVSFALFNVLALVSRTANSFQGIFLAKRMETNLSVEGTRHLLTDFRWLLFSSSVATLAGAFLIPTFQRLFSKAVRDFQTHRSIPRLLLRGFFKGGLAFLKDNASLPSAASVADLCTHSGMSAKIVVMNILTVALWTVGVFASLYAGSLHPELRVTSNSLSSLINGLATIMMFIFLDPHLSMMTDDVIEGRLSESSFRRATAWLVGSRLAGTLVAQILLVPAADLIAIVAKRM